ncbi:MAG: hypothetical protein HWE39_22915 [Oceanospirillaceae bacterium]|nr:hypothetical protein [Oceanospirillaceae bacterium]
MIGIVLLLLSGCGGEYRRQPVPPQNASEDGRFDGLWVGSLQSRYRLRPVASYSNLYKTLVCEPYRDQVRLDVSRGRIDAELGRASRYRLRTYLDRSGRFYQLQDLPLAGSNRAGTGAQLSIAGQFDPVSGLVEGIVIVTPNGFTQGCVGDFEARLDAAAIAAPAVERPFSPAFHLIELRDHK